MSSFTRNDIDIYFMLMLLNQQPKLEPWCNLTIRIQTLNISCIALNYWCLYWVKKNNIKYKCRYEEVFTFREKKLRKTTFFKNPTGFNVKIMKQGPLKMPKIIDGM